MKKMGTTEMKMVEMMDCAIEGRGFMISLITSNNL